MEETKKSWDEAKVTSAEDFLNSDESQGLTSAEMLVAYADKVNRERVEHALTAQSEMMTELTEKDNVNNRLKDAVYSLICKICNKKPDDKDVFEFISGFEHIYRVTDEVKLLKELNYGND